jgi:hypothetical protein
MQCRQVISGDTNKGRLEFGVKAVCSSGTGSRQRLAIESGHVSTQHAGANPPSETLRRNLRGDVNNTGDLLQFNRVGSDCSPGDQAQAQTLPTV